MFPLSVIQIFMDQYIYFASILFLRFPSRRRDRVALVITLVVAERCFLDGFNMGQVLRKLLEVFYTKKLDIVVIGLENRYEQATKRRRAPFQCCFPTCFSQSLHSFSRF